MSDGSARAMSKKITIGFTFENEFEDRFSASTTADTLGSFGESDVGFIGRQLNTFLKQCGYLRDNEYIFMEDVTEEEMAALESYLTELRYGEKESK